MIVLAIAGLVLGIVFIAVPALQRNSRNTQRTADINNIAAGITTYSTNENGAIPKTEAELIGIIGPNNPIAESIYYAKDDPANQVIAGDGTVPSANEEDGFNIVVSPSSNPVKAGHVLPSPDNLHIWIGYKCAKSEMSGGNPERSSAKYTTADLEKTSSRSYAMVYQLEGQDNAECDSN